MKKYIIIILVLGIASAGFYLISRKAAEKAQAKEKIQTMPNFSFLALDSTVFSAADLAAQKTILLYFNSTCEHCQYEASEVRKNMSQFAKVNLVFVSEENLAEIRAFSKKYALDKEENVKFLKAPNHGFYQVFGSSPIPSIFIYNTERQLVKNYKGETKIELLIKNLE